MNDRRTDHPAPLVVAASLVAVEGLVLLLLASELASSSSQRLTMGVTTAGFFAVYGGALLLLAWSVHRGRSWRAARSCWPSSSSSGSRELPGDTTLVAVVSPSWRPSWWWACSIRPASTRWPTTPLGLDLQRAAQLRQRAGQQPGDVHLRDADLVGDLRLGHVLEEPQQQDLLRRGSSWSSSGLSDSRISTCSRSASSTPMAPSMVAAAPSSPLSLASSESVA